MGFGQVPVDKKHETNALIPWEMELGPISGLTIMLSGKHKS
jgi:hypothetical protein